LPADLIELKLDRAAGQAPEGFEQGACMSA
jgi:hypothetical protein